MTSDTPKPNSYWVLRRSLLAGEYPGSLDEDEAKLRVLYLLNLGVTVFIDLTEEGERNPYFDVLSEQADNLSISAQYQRRPIRYLGVPTAEAMISSLDAIDDAVASGAVVYLHCSNGVGRTGTVLGCYLVRHGLTGIEALEQIARLRQSTPDGWREATETQEQREMVLFPWKARETR